MTEAAAAAAAAANPAAPKWPDVLYTRELQDKVARAKVLAVGAGGIGCELLKTLVLSGFRDVHTIDLDTIETSNLNRQFLFRRAHVSQPKAEVAAAAVRAFAPAAPPTPPAADANAADANAKAPTVRGERANIKEPRFDVDFFRAFDVVLNGLDNAEARRHVNRLCLAAGVPLVESGTAGYLGQVTVHVRALSQCYECTPKPPATKTYPVCTLRNTPDKPIHCVVWAKDLLFAQLFGGAGAVTDLDDRGAAGGGGGGEEAAAAAGGGDGGGGGDGATTKEANGGEQENGDKAAAEAEAEANKRKAAEEEAAERASAFARREDEPALAYAARVFEHEYGSMVRRLASNASLWAPKGGGGGPAAVGRAQPPEPLSLAALLSLPPSPSSALSPEALAALAAALGLPADATTATTTTATPTRSAARSIGLSDDHRLWTEAESAKVWLRAAAALLDERPGGVTEAFDKDDDLAVDFVVASANLRGACFGIPPQTRFAAKGMAGNIIHAIATTNAAVAGLVVVEATKLLAGLAPQACHSTFLNEADRRTGRARAPYRVLLARAALEPPSKGCMACGRAVVTLRADTTKLTLERLVSRVLKGQLALNEPTLVSDSGFMYEEGEGLEEDEREANAAMLPKALAELPGGGVKGGAVLSVSDQSQGGVRVEVVVRHDASLDELEAPEGFLLEGWAGPAAAKAEEEEGKEKGEAAQAGAAKRARAAEGAGDGNGDEAAGAKRARADDAMAAAAADDDGGGPVQIVSSDGGGGGGGGGAGGGEDGGEIVLSSD